MNRNPALLAERAFVWMPGVAVFFLSGWCASSQLAPHLSITQPGGMPGWPVLMGIERVTNGLSLTWDGPSGYYQVFRMGSLKDKSWVAVGGRTNLARRAILPVTPSNAFFRISGPAPHYTGAQACTACHSAIHTSELRTRHAAAFTNALFVAKGGQINSSCLACHTVGYRLPTGFSSVTNSISSNSLAGVQCENCHGPAANHAANEDDPTVRPQVEIAAAVCGGCHTGSHHPTYDEWQGSGHGAVVEDALAVMNTSTNNLSGCGRCHSGSVRLSLLKGNPLPVGDANVAIECVVCHDPHQTNGYPAQLRNPVASTNDYYLTTSASFATTYNPRINLCGQCHNHSGASWTTTSRAPHHSPQYNMLIGTVGLLESGVPPDAPGSHALLITNQCAGCHLQTQPYVSAAQPANTGHSFTVQSYNSCLACHPLPQPLTQFTMLAVSNHIDQLKFELDFWASSRAPMQLWTNYGVRSWEYTLPGDLSPGGSGPSAADQALVPVNIQKARFNLYIVLYDGSYGVHNVIYATTLLDTAENWILDELGN
jgi:hypothetical protein